MAHQGSSYVGFGLQQLSLDDKDEVPLDGDEEIRQRFHEVALVLGDARDEGIGSLLITSRRVIWISERTQPVLAAPFNTINLHAMAQADGVYSKPCIYMQTEPNLSDQGDVDTEDDNEDDEADDIESPELRLVPRDSSKLQEIFQVMCDCAALNPDNCIDDDGEDEGFFYDEDAAMENAGTDDRAEMLDHLDSLLQMPRADELDDLLAEDPGRFADPDDEAEDHWAQHSNGVDGAS